MQRVCSAPEELQKLKSKKPSKGQDALEVLNWARREEVEGCKEPGASGSLDSEDDFRSTKSSALTFKKSNRRFLEKYTRRTLPNHAVLVDSLEGENILRKGERNYLTVSAWTGAWHLGGSLNKIKATKLAKVVGCITRSLEFSRGRMH